MIDNIDWNKLKPYKNSKNQSFEKLCYLIANRHFKDQGQFTPIDDSGGGDGVEFYLTLPNGDVWGWQAKFFQGNPRLSYSGRKPSIKKSLEKACKVHPNLKKWFLCTHFDFTPKENKWFFETLQKSISNGMAELIHWGDSDFVKLMSEERFHGIYQFFFGELKLNLKWFKTQCEKQIAGVGNEFDSSLHTETRVDDNLHALFGDEKFVQQITKSIKKTKKELHDLEERINNLKGQIPNEIEWDEDEKTKVIEAAESLQCTLLNTIDQFEEAIEFLNNKRISEAQTVDFPSILSQLEESQGIYETIGNESGISKIEYIGEGENERQVQQNIISIIQRPSYLVTSLLHSFYIIKQWFELINQSDLHIFGNAGVGKTHIACNICSDRLRTGLPALFIRGECFRSDQPVEEQLLRILGISNSHNWYEFLPALSAAAEAYQTRIPLIIDGLNESIHNGAFSKVWRLGLKGLIQEISKTSNVVLITTYRNSYKEAIWGGESPVNIIAAEGFDAHEDVEQAVKKYFQTYKIVADPLPSQLTQFKIPIYLKIFCETINPNREAEKHIDVEEWTLFEVFDRYLEKCNQEVSKRLDLEPEAQVVQSELNKVAEYLWEYRCRYIGIEDMANIIDKQPLQELKKSTSKMRALEDEGLLVFRDWVEDTEIISFTYDLLGGYLIAKHIIRVSASHRQSYLRRAVLNIFGKELKNLHPFLNWGKNCLVNIIPFQICRFFYSIFGYKTHHPLFDDIGKCLAALIPSKTGQFLHEISNNETAIRYSIRALFDISPQDITENCKHLVAYLFDEYKEYRNCFLNLAESTVGHSNHPFNASFWSERLSILSMSERDLSWTEHVRSNRERFEELVKRFEETCKNDKEISELSAKRLHLLAEHIMWILTSTVRPLRDKATRALYWYGRLFPNEFFDLGLKSFSINDPYVSERMLAATYGIAMARQNDFDDISFVDEMLPKYAKKLYESMFKPNAPHATTHILARDFAKRTIDIALIHNPDLLSDNERGRITPPFTDGGIREWKEIDVSDNMHRGPLRMDFRNYTIGTLVEGRGNYNFEHTEYKRVLRNISWKIHELGYSQESFEIIDGRIGAQNQHFGRSANGGKTDRYGKKYSWIAFFEYVGYLQDQDLLPEYYNHHRIGETDIDPSFPSEVRRYELVTQDYLGTDIEDSDEWVKGIPQTDLKDYSSVNQICKEEGPWILLQGTFRQENIEKTRDIFSFFQGVLVKTDEVESIVEFIEDHENIDGWRISPPEDYYTFAGEIPWCDTYPLNSWIELSISRDFDETYDTLIPQILSPVRVNNWEDYHSTIIPGQNVATPSRQITKCLDLCGVPQSYDLFEKESGKRASFSIEFRQKWGNAQRFTYLRKDLLDRYLKEKDEVLIWIIFGDKRVLTPNADGPYKLFHDVKIYQRRQKDSE